MDRKSLERFYKKVEKDTAGTCLLWTAGKAGKGYGYFWHEGRMKRAHKVLWEHENGPVPDGFDLDHLCRVRHCVNPDHLEPVTRSENNKRGSSTRLVNKCRRGHVILNDSDFYYDKKGRRECRMCRKLRRDNNWRTKYE